MTTLLGAVCTYRRPGDLHIMLDAIAAQTRRPDRLVIVDNDADPAISALVAAHPLSASIPVETVCGEDNPGPAGAFALAFETFRPIANGDDMFIVFDDDDPPPADNLLAELVSIADASFTDPLVAGVGLRGGLLNTRTGFIEPRPQRPGETTEPSDHLHGGWFPVYRFSALEAVDHFDPSFFWGFEELELGRRLTAQGFELRVASELYFAVASHQPTRKHPVLTALHEPSWRHFYRHRNLIRVLRRDRAWSALLVMIAGRLILKPILHAPRNPRRAAWHLRTNCRAIVEGLGHQPRAAKHPHHLPA